MSMRSVLLVETVEGEEVALLFRDEPGAQAWQAQHPTVVARRVRTVSHLTAERIAVSA